MNTTVCLAVLAALAAAALAPTRADAHAHLRSAQPAVGSTIPTSPPELAITYTEGVEPRFSTIEVQDAQGHRVDKQDPHTAPGNDAILAVSLPALPPGTYKVIWHATAVDTHKTEGTFDFTIKP